MRRYTRIIFGANAAYQTALGFICLLAPSLAVGIYGGTGLEQESSMLTLCFRLLGVNLVPVGVMSALIAANPDGSTVLRQLMGLFAVLTLVCWGVAVSAHDLSLSQIALVTWNGAMQLAVIIGVVGYAPSARFQQFVVRRRAA
jgi:hypothetical protein